MILTSKEKGRASLSRGKASTGRLRAALLVACASLLASSTAFADLPAWRLLFDSPLPWLLPVGSVEGSSRPEVSLRSPQPFPPGDRGRIERTSILVPFAIAGALAERVEGSVRFGIARTGGIDDSGGGVPTDTRLRFGYAFPSGPTSLGALAAWLSAKLPTGPDRGGISTDESDIGLGLSAGRKAGPVVLIAHAGIELLGNPLRNGSQDDVATYGLGAGWQRTERLGLSAEISGRAFSRFDGSASSIALGVAWGTGRHGRSTWSTGGSLLHGLNADSATWGFHLFLSAARF